ncbi:MAG: bifunctional hydroxymethylpyrimidine kinase/phosphomethylpyrimidine kinase [Treponema sp.]|nr:bifunctional hydroxymethylpyrimidine kinase/phosphomethylpyrimidine kinase [Treponema sp.]
MKTALSIAGSDCSGGAGLQADIKTFSAHGVYGMTVVTSVVAENTVRVIKYQDISPDIIKMQMDAVFEDIVPDAVKIGMLSCSEAMKAVAEKLKEWKPLNVVIDPVMYAKNGSALMNPSAVNTLISEIVPLADILTPNILEAEKITEMKIKSLDAMKEAAKYIYALGCRAVIIKGGHSDGDAVDILFDGNKFFEFSAPRIDTKHTHGTGCTFSSAITSNIALGQNIETAVKNAKDYINNAITFAPNLGKGNGPTQHFFAMFNNNATEEENA